MNVRGSQDPVRDAAIVAALEADPNLTLEAVGQRYGLSRERIRQIWKRAKGSTRGWPEDRDHKNNRICKVCGKTYKAGHGDDHERETGHHPRKTNFVRATEWKRLYEEDGLSSVQIGRIYGVPAQYIVAVLHRYGAMLKPRGRKGDIVVRRTRVERLDEP